MRSKKRFNILCSHQILSHSDAFTKTLINGPRKVNSNRDGWRLRHWRNQLRSAPGLCPQRLDLEGNPFRPVLSETPGLLEMSYRGKNWKEMKVSLCQIFSNGIGKIVRSAELAP